MAAGDYPSDPYEIEEYIKDGRLKVGKVELWKTDTLTIPMKDGDIYVKCATSSHGWGDPLERDPKLVASDVNRGWLRPELAPWLYGVVLKEQQGNWVADDEATQQKRQELKQRRRQRAIPYKEWWLKERQRVLAGDFEPVIKELYQDCLKYEKFAKMFREAWALSEAEHPEWQQVH